MFFYYLKRIYKLGLYKTLQRCVWHTNVQLFAWRWKHKALDGQAGHTWEKITRKNISHPFDFATKWLRSGRMEKNNTICSFDTFFTKLTQHDFITPIRDTFAQKYVPDKSTLSKPFVLRAPLSLSKGEVEACPEPCRREYERRAHNQNTQTPNVNYTFAHVFYRDIKPSRTDPKNQDSIAPDIKDPWEFSRFSHLHTQSSDEFYATITAWLTQNSYLIGVNWACAMEVAIRATNLIWLFYQHCHNPEIPKAFWEKYICSLYDHAHYLENHWETSDRPNNHYIADLVGYLYLCVFFNVPVRPERSPLGAKSNGFERFISAQKVYLQKLIEQLDHQVQSDGTCYEGSTSYHKLVTQLYQHVQALCAQESIILPERVKHTIEHMASFIQACTDNKGNFIQIGDNDSGFLVYTYNDKSNDKSVKPEQEQNLAPLKIYPNFGLSIINTNNYHITFRHPTYTNKQPTGHFHYDQLSITLSIDGIPVLVDPGSYIYTASAYWRNKFRSHDYHTTFYTKPVPSNRDLFMLERQESNFMLRDARVARSSARTDGCVFPVRPEVPTEAHEGLVEACHEAARMGSNRTDQTQNSHITIQDSYQENTWESARAYRKLTYNTQNNKIVIHDWWQNAHNKTGYWSFMFAPNIKLKQILKQKNIYVWEIQYQNQALCYLKSTLLLSIQNAFYSPDYGTKTPCIKLAASSPCSAHPHITTINKNSTMSQLA